MDEDAKKIINEARQAIGGNQNAKALQLLNKALESYGDDISVCNQAWYYLTYVEETAEKRFINIKKVLKSYPGNADILNKFNQLRMEVIAEVKAAVNRNEKTVARRLLLEISEVEKNSEDIWLQLLEVAETDKERCQYLEKIVALNPDNKEALAQLGDIREQLSTQASQQETGNGGSITGDTQIPPGETQAPERKIGVWNHPFKNEMQVCEYFEENLDKLIEIAQRMDNEPGVQLRSLNFAKKAKQEKWKAGDWANVVLNPAVQPAADIAEKLMEEKKYPDAFWVSNVFGEMCKILVERNRKKYSEYFDRLVFAACCAAGAEKSEALNRSRSDKVEEEMKVLEKHIRHSCLNGAFGTFYHAKKETYFSAKSGLQSASAKHISNDALAWSFDHSLHYLLKFDRPQVKAYVWRNLPIVFKLKLSDRWSKKRKKWEDLLKIEGYQDVIRDLKDMRVLVNPDEVGIISQEVLEDIQRAERENDYKKINQMLRESANELMDYLYAEVQEKLMYISPPFPWFQNQKLRWEFQKVPPRAATGGPEDLEQCIDTTKEVWKQEIENTVLQDWLGYLYAKSGNLPAAENELERARLRRSGVEENFVTDWNLAALFFERRDEERAYKYLLPLRDSKRADAKLFNILLALSHKLGDKQRFLSIVPRTMSQQFLPLAFTVAYELKDEKSQKEFLAKIMRGPGWQPPQVDKRRIDITALKENINDAIVEGQIDQLIQWLKEYIKKIPRFIPPYVELAKILEDERKDIDGAYEVLKERLKIQQQIKKAEQRYIEIACRDLLDLCKRNNRTDLGQKAYKIVAGTKVNPPLLKPFKKFAPEDLPKKEENKKVEPPIKLPIELPPLEPSPPDNAPPPHDPLLPKQLAWVNAGLTKVRTTAAYVREKQTIEEYIKILGKMNPHESDRVVEIIRTLTETIDSFTKNDNTDVRVSLYQKAADYEKRLAQLLENLEKNQIFKDLVYVLTPYFSALKHVMGDLSKQAGLTPDVEPNIENAFFSLETVHSTLVVRVANKSARRVTDIVIDLSAETPAVSVRDENVQKIEELQPNSSQLLNFPIERKDGNLEGVSELVFNAFLKASAEGFKDIDMGVKKLRVPIKTFSQVIPNGRLNKVFQVGQSLKPSEANPGIFQGRDDVLNRIKGSFHGGVQSERYFLDGIRRVGKTSIINFLPKYLPENTIPVFIDFDLHSSGLRGTHDSTAVLQNFCEAIIKRVNETTGTTLPEPGAEMFRQDAGKAFQGFLGSFKQMLPDKIPLLMIDEFQDLLYAISRTGTGEEEQDTLVLDQLRGLMDRGHLYMLCTGSVRFDRLSNIIRHRIFGSMTRMPISFLSEESTGNVLRAGFESPVEIPPETIRSIYELTGGYPWLVQAYGSMLIDLLNEERRTVATPSDVTFITDHNLLTDHHKFEFWWPSDQLGIDEERFIERLFQEFPNQSSVSIRDFFDDIRSQERNAYMKAFQNLRYCEVLDSSEASTLEIRGSALRKWLLTHMQADNRLKIMVQKEANKKEANKEVTTIEQGKIAMFVDHENLIKSLERISQARGIVVPNGPGKSEWLSAIIKTLLEEAERRVGNINYRITVAFWSRPEEAQLLPAYFANGFSPKQPMDIKMSNAVDFNLVDEVRQVQQQASREQSHLGAVIIISGDGDYATMVRNLVNERIDVQIWGGSKATNKNYTQIVGDDRVIMLDDVCGL